jgi:hypothetical protein
LLLNTHTVRSLEIFAFFMLTGIASTLLLPETKGKSLEELSNENQVGFLRGALPRFSFFLIHDSHHFFLLKARRQ